MVSNTAEGLPGFCYRNSHSTVYIARIRKTPKYFHIQRSARVKASRSKVEM